MLKYTNVRHYSLNVRLEEHRKAVYLAEFSKSAMANHIQKEKGNHLSLWDVVKMIDREERRRIKRLKEAVRMVGYSDLYIEEQKN